MSEQSDRANPKPPHLDRLSPLWRRINDHKVVQWGVAYIALAYAIQHAVILTSESLDWPHAVARVSMLLLVLGLPVVMTLAWYHGMRASRRISGPELTIISILLMIGSMLFFVLVEPASEVAQKVAPAASVRTPAGLSVAVLPFVNLSSDKEQEFFSDGMTEEITSALAKVLNLRVVGRTSAFQFKGENKDLRAIGQALSATHLIEGSVRKDGNQVRITAQLIKADDGTHLWTESYDRELKGIFAVQEEIAQAIAASLQVPLGLKQGEALVSNRTGDTESYQNYLRAKALFRARAAANSLSDATTLLEQVIVRDPGYAPAWALMAQAFALAPSFAATPFPGNSADAFRRLADGALTKAEAAASRAAELDPRNADAYTALGDARAFRGKFLEAEDLFKRALALDPVNPDALNAYSRTLAELGRVKEAVAMRQQLRSLEPLVPVFNAITERYLWVDGQNEAALTVAKALPSDYPLRALELSSIYASTGRFKEAADVLSTMPAGVAPLGVIETTAQLLRKAPAPAAQQDMPYLGYGSFAYLYTGAPERSLEQAEFYAEAGYLVMIVNASFWHSSYAPVRKTERFKTLLRKAGLVEYWRARGWPEFCHPVGATDFACT